MAGCHRCPHCTITMVFVGVSCRQPISHAGNVVVAQLVVQSKLSSVGACALSTAPSEQRCTSHPPAVPHCDWTASRPPRVLLRMHKEGECAASECSLVCNDFLRSGYSNFVVDPGVRQVCCPAAGTQQPHSQPQPKAAQATWRTPPLRVPCPLAAQRAVWRVRACLALTPPQTLRCAQLPGAATRSPCARASVAQSHAEPRRARADGCVPASPAADGAGRRRTR